MATRLQEEFTRSRLIQNLFIDADLIGIPLNGSRRIVRQMVKEMLRDMSEVRIKYLLYYSFQCCDVTDEQKAEAVRLLKLSETLLTTKQQQALKRKLAQ